MKTMKQQLMVAGDISVSGLAPEDELSADDALRLVDSEISEGKVRCARVAPSECGVYCRFVPYDTIPRPFVVFPDVISDWRWRC